MTDYRIQDYTNESTQEILDIDDKALEPYGLKQFYSRAKLENIATYSQNSGIIFLVIKIQNTLIGFGGIDNNYEGVVGSIMWMRILPEYQGKGIGSALLKELLNRAKQAGYKRLYLDTTTAQDAGPLYQKFGFTEFTRLPPKSKDDFTDVFYELHL